MNKVTIIMPVYNNLHYTKQAIESLKSFTNPNEYDLIIIENGSDKESKDYIKEICNTYDNFAFIDIEENIGYVKAVNKGLCWPNINTDLILVASNDILFEEEWLSKMILRFEDEAVGMVGPTSNFVTGRQHTSFNGLSKTEESKFLVGFFWMIRKSIVEEIGVLDEVFGIGGSDDIDYSIRVANTGYKMVIARDVYIHHFGSKTIINDIGGNNKYNEYWKEKDELLRDKWGDDIVNSTFSLEQQKAVRIGWGLPLRTNYVHRLFWASSAMLQKPGKWDLISCPRQIIHDSRNLIAKKAIELECDYILYTDDDHQFPSDAAIRLINHNKDIVGALAFQRRPDFLPCVFMIKPDEGPHSIELIKQGLQEVDAIGFAFILIKIEVFKKMEFPWFKYGDMRYYPEKGGLGEDLSFCLKAKELGFKVWCDTDLIVPHIGDELLVDENVFYQHRASGSKKESFTMVDGTKVI